MGLGRGMLRARFSGTFMLLGLLLGLSACGYQLRGYTSVPEALKTLDLQASDTSSLGRSLRRRLQANGIQVDGGESARYRLTLLSENHGRRAVSLTSRAKTEEYELYSRARFQVSDAQGRLLLGPESLEVERTYTFDSNNVNAKDAERNLLRQEMLDHLSGQIIRQYLSLAPDAN